MIPEVSPKEARTGVYLAVFAATASIMAILVFAMVNLNQPADNTAARVEERHKNLQDLKALNGDVLHNYAWQDQAKGFVRLPVELAKEIAVNEWKNPAAARTNLISRMEKLNAAPPKEPEKPSQYE